MEYIKSPRLQNENDLYYTGYGCTWGIDLDGKRYLKLFHPEITENNLNKYLKLGDIVDDNLRAEMQSKEWDLDISFFYIVENALGFQKIKIIEKTKNTYLVHNCDTKETYRTGRHLFHTMNVVREEIPNRLM